MKSEIFNSILIDSIFISKRVVFILAFKINIMFFCFIPFGKLKIIITLYCLDEFIEVCYIKK